MEMKPYADRTVGTQYSDVLRFVLENGEVVQSQQEKDAITFIAPPPMRFKLANGFPLIMERNIQSFWKQALGEIFAFINGARTLEELEKFGCKWWAPWGTQEKCSKRGLATGDLGPGSYGAAFHDFPTADGGTFNQWQHIVEQATELPHLRTHFVSPWIPQYVVRGKGKQQKVVVGCCHGWVHIRILNGKLTLHMFQRSADLPVGVPSNIAQYAALTMALAHVLNVEAYEYVHSFSDAHIYVDQVDAVKEMLSREPRRFPTVTMDTSITNLFDFRREHFVLGDDYDAHPAMKEIPVAI
jgi:thymidylate synthase